ncbi:MAG: succinate dehydrogenase cytochrome b subunit [Lentisphaeria bacterium]|nr:succinate dehydrogenase cytochrome b subunit [Candidatus Neomarinimicrobiota bacterium]MCF7843091.1 succinate dehydrogenase cytochrome b subunit [Lentisphaeria bacterium]
MLPFLTAAKSSVGKKYLMALTGLFWVLFLIIHLAGNLVLLSGHSDAYNKYSHFLLSLGELLYVLEFILLAFILLHIYSGITVAIGKLRARPQSYKVQKNLGGASRKTVSATTMIYSGLLLFIFLVVHISHFKYQVGVNGDYTTVIGGVEMHDFYRLVYDSFSYGWYVLFYEVIMILVFSHLRHGFWSGFQSLGVNHPRWSPFIDGLGIVIAVVVGFGFLVIPLYIYFIGGA